MGVPRVYCECKVCTEARTTGRNRRWRSSVIVKTPAGTMWLDCGPDWRLQAEAAGLREAGIVLLTHAHHDHIGGIPDLADASRWTGRRARVLAPGPVLATVRSRYPWVGAHLELVELDGEAEVLGFRVHVWSVNHGHNGRSYAYRFEGPGGLWAYCPDSIHLEAEERAPLRGLDLLVLGTSYYRDEAPLERRSVYDMVEALELLADVRPRRALFTHLSHGVDVRVPYPLPPNVGLATDGLEVEL